MPQKNKKRGKERIFIDTNIYLEYFRMSSATISSLGWLLDSLEKGRLDLILPKQIEDEYWRNKQSTINQARKEILNQFPQKPKLPSPVKSLPEARKVEEVYSQFKKRFDKLVERYDREFKKKTKTEELIEKIFKKAEYAADNQNIIKKAYYRYLKGNPPGKNKSFGDAIIWETLLEKFINQNLTIITEDEDWYTDKEKKSLNELLIIEWKRKTSKKLKFSVSLASFINQFTGKATIKKTVVQEEKAPKGYFPSVLGAPGVLDTGTITARDFYTHDLSRATPSAYDLLRVSTPEFYRGIGEILSKKTCPHCFKENEFDANYCSSCGRSFSLQP